MRLPLNNNPRVTTEFMVAEKMASLGRHLGVDYAAVIGTPVYAPGNGTVSDVSIGAAGGKTIAVDIGNYTWRFLHLNSQDVRKGQSVREGQVIGTTGKTGNVTGPHLHVDTRNKGTAWNASLSNYRDPRAVVSEANKPAPAQSSGKRLMFTSLGQIATFYKVSGGEFKMKITDFEGWRVLAQEPRRVKVNSRSAGGDCWVYLIDSSGKTIPGRYLK